MAAFHGASQALLSSVLADTERGADTPQCNGINQIDVPPDQRGKGFVGAVFRILPQKHAVIC